MLQNVLTVLTVVGSTIAILDAYSKVQSVVHQSKLRDAELDSLISKMQLKLDHQSDKVELLFNGLKEGIDHLKLRVTTDLKEVHSMLADMEGYLQKNTSYERRAR